MEKCPASIMTNDSTMIYGAFYSAHDSIAKLDISLEDVAPKLRVSFLIERKSISYKRESNE